MDFSKTTRPENFEERHEIYMQDGVIQNISSQAIFELIRDIKDPEHDFTLEELNVVRQEFIKIYNIIDNDRLGSPVKCIDVVFEPTIPHCSMAAIIGLTIKILLEKYVKDFYIIVSILENSHVNYKTLNKQLKDKDRVQAASENESLMEIIDECIFFAKTKYGDV